MKLNKTNAAGIHITEASPVDDRLIIVQNRRSLFW
jgi:hypothetical protein